MKLRFSHDVPQLRFDGRHGLKNFFYPSTNLLSFALLSESKLFSDLNVSPGEMDTGKSRPLSRSLVRRDSGNAFRNNSAASPDLLPLDSFVDSDVDGTINFQ